MPASALIPLGVFWKADSIRPRTSERASGSSCSPKIMEFNVNSITPIGPQAGTATGRAGHANEEEERGEGSISFSTDGNLPYQTRTAE